MMSNFKFVGVAVAALSLGGAAVAGTSHAADLGQDGGERAIQSDDDSTELAGDAYAVSVSAATVKAGASGSFNVVIKAKGDHKVNEKYPHKVKWEDPPSGVELPKKKLTKGDGSFSDKKTFTFAVPVKGKSAGSHTVEGKVKFSVCNESQCVIKKVPVTATVNVT